MTQLNDRFITLPSYINLTREGLEYRDLLTYITIRSFHNTANDKCIPSYDTISKVSCMSKPFITKSISRLERAGYLEVHRSDVKRKSNHYYFKKHHAFERIPYSIFSADDLTANQKAMLIAMRPCFSSGSLEFTMGDIKNVSLLLDVSYKTVYTQYKALVAKGYIEKYEKVYTTHYKKEKIKLSDKLNWKYDLPQLKKPNPTLTVDLSSLLYIK